MGNGGKRGAGERVLEGRHVIGLFLGVILLSGLFFTLGYVMGRNQTEGRVSADEFREKAVLPKQDAAAKRANKDAPVGPPKSDSEAPANSDWEFYRAGESKKTEDRLKPAPAASLKNEPSVVKTAGASKGTNGNAKNPIGPATPGSSYTLQVAAMTREGDALDLAKQLQRKKFPAFVISPHGDKYFRVQVGPYVDQKAAEAARKGLESAGFKAFVKH